MNRYNLCIAIILLSIIVGCSKHPEIKYNEVLIPVTQKLYKPDRPIYLSSDNTYSYLLKVLDYTNLLETIIETNNKNVKE